jgi:hypothetical protein
LPVVVVNNNIISHLHIQYEECISFLVFKIPFYFIYYLRFRY